MQQIGGWLSGVCFAAALGGIVCLLSPSGRSDRMLRLLTSLFILAAAAVPLGAAVRSISVRPVREQTDIAVSAVLQNAETALKQTARSVLERHGFPDASIRVSAIVQNGEVHAQPFEITGVAGEKAQEIADEIYALTGEMPHVAADAAPADGG